MGSWSGNSPKPRVCFRSKIGAAHPHQKCFYRGPSLWNEHCWMKLMRSINNRHDSLRTNCAVMSILNRRWAIATIAVYPGLSRHCPWCLWCLRVRTVYSMVFALGGPQLASVGCCVSGVGKNQGMGLITLTQIVCCLIGLTCDTDGQDPIHRNEKWLLRVNSIWNISKSFSYRFIQCLWHTMAGKLKLQSAAVTLYSMLWPTDG